MEVADGVLADKEWSILVCSPRDLLPNADHCHGNKVYHHFQSRVFSSTTDRIWHTSSIIVFSLLVVQSISQVNWHGSSIPCVLLVVAFYVDFGYAASDYY
jgi:hypothetical protein